MADDITTVLRFVGDAGNAEAAIKSLIASLQKAASSTANLFSNIASGSAQASSAVNQASAAADRAAKSTRQAADNSLALAQASARLQVAQGNAAGAVQTLKTALDGVDRNTVAAIRAQTQLVSVEAQLASAAGKAETAMLREAQALARLQQIAGDTPAAIKTLGDALERVTNRSSLAAIRAELQKTYLDTGYANSPLIGALDRINKSLGTFSPLLGTTGAGLQRVIGFARGAAESLQNTRSAVEANAKSANVFFEKIKQVNQAIVKFSKDQEGSATLSLGLTNALDLVGRAGERVRESLRRAGESLRSFFGRATGRSQFITLFAGADKVQADVKELTAELPKLTNASKLAAAGLSGMGGAAGALGAGIAVLTAVVVALEVAILKLAKSVADELAPLDRLSDRTGIAEAELFKLKIASEAVGVTFETTIEQIDFFNSSLARAANEGAANKLSKQLKQFGIDAREAANNPGKAFDELAKKIGAIENPTQRMAAVTSFFGEEGRKLVPVFIELTRNAGQYQQVLDALGGMQGVKRIIQSSNELDRELKKLGAQFKVLQVLVAKEVIPSMVVAVRNLIPVIRDIAPAAILTGKLAANGLLVFVAAVQTAKNQLESLLAAYVAFQAGEARLGLKAVRDAFGQSLAVNFQLLKAQLDAIGKSGDLAFGNFVASGDKADKAAKKASEALRRLENQLREEEEINRANQEALKRTFDQKLIDEAEFVQRQRELIEQRLRTTLDLLQKERDIISSKAFPKEQRAGELERIERDRRGARRKAVEETEKAEIESQDRIEKLAIQRTEAEVEVAERSLARQQAAVERAIELRAITFEEGERRLAEITQRGIELRLALANAELDRAGANSAEREVIQQKVIALEIQLAEAAETAQRRIQDARQKDAEAFREFIQDRVQSLINLRRAEIDAQAAQTALALQRRQITSREAEQAEFDERIALLRIETEERKRQIEEEAEALRERARQAGVLALAEVEIERQKNAALKAERDRAAAEEQALREQRRAVELTPGFGADAAGAIAGLETILERELTLWEQNTVAAQVYAQTLEEAANNAFEKAKNVLGNLQAASTAAVDAFVQSGGSLKAAGKALAQALAAPFIEAAKTRAAFEFAEAIASLAVFDFRGFALHAAAGAAFAALAAVATRLTSGGGGATGGAVAAAGAGSAGARTQPETREINQNTPRPEPVVIILRAEHAPGIIVERVIEDFNNNGRTRDIFGAT
jgi:hypothetical protein